MLAVLKIYEAIKAVGLNCETKNAHLSKCGRVKRNG